MVMITDTCPCNYPSKNHTQHHHKLLAAAVAAASIVTMVAEGMVVKPWKSSDAATAMQQ